MKGVPPPLLLMLVLAAGCQDPKADMGDQPKYDPYQESPLFADGRSERPTVAGTVPRPDGGVPGMPWVSHGPTHDTARPGLPEGPAPVPLTADLIRRGQTGFDVYCSACHGRLGNGQGMIVQRGLTPPPSFHIPRLVNAPDSHFYNVITHGYGAMYGYAERVPADERWEIIAYIRVLQSAGQRADPESRKALIAGGDRAGPTPREGGPQ